ncbi:MAG: oxygenase MpaB family protein [Candidatus Limnocylindria bacterium]
MDGGTAPGRPLTGDVAGLFGPGSAAWQFQREAFLLLGAGPRALLLQLAHPAVAAGVADHSDFRADPWRRLSGTLRSYLRIVFGTRAAARDEIRRLHRLHRTVTGPGYEARDPTLALWVHATLVDSTLAVNAAWDGPLGRWQAERFYAESLPLGRAFGIPDAALPPDLAAFERYMADQIGPGGPVVVGATARELAEAVLHPPLPGALGRLPLDRRLHGWLLWPAVGLLPARVRAAYGLPWGPLERAVAAWLVAGWRAWNARLPAGWRAMPQALAAERRLADRPASTPVGQ